VILELLEPNEPQIGDMVSHGDFSLMGEAIYRNETQHIPVRVFVQNFVGTPEQAKRQCFLA